MDTCRNVTSPHNALWRCPEVRNLDYWFSDGHSSSRRSNQKGRKVETITTEKVSIVAVAETTVSAVVSHQQNDENKNNGESKLSITGSSSSTPTLISFAIVCFGAFLYKKSKQHR